MMTELKVIKNVTYTFTTSDGKEFYDEHEAKIWQKHLSIFNNMNILDIEFVPTKEINRAFYVHTKTQEEVDAFNEMQNDLQYISTIDGIGYYYYDEISDSYINIETQIKELQSIINKLKDGEQE